MQAMTVKSNSVVTIFGGDGFIGRHVVYLLAKTGAEIRVASRNANQAAQLRPAGAVGQIVPVACNITRESNIRKVLDGSTHVINLVGLLYQTGENTFDKVHAEAPAMIGRVASEMGIKHLVHVSAIGASDDAPSRYLRSKAAGETALWETFPKAVILRPSIVFGAGDGFFNLFASLARFAPVLPLIGGGETKFQPVYVEDVVAAIDKGLNDPACAGQTYELGGPRVATFKECLELMMKESGQKRMLIPAPFSLCRIKARFLELMPKPLLTQDQVDSLTVDNVVSEDAKGFADLEIQPAPMELILPQYLWRFRDGGRFNHKKAS
ncbi:MAG: complex I NDUFA9 subunit family protein [Alphaproteobacteria bacterium]